MATSKILIPVSLALLIGAIGNGRADSRTPDGPTDVCTFANDLAETLAPVDRAVLPTRSNDVGAWQETAEAGRTFQDTLNAAGRAGQWAAAADGVRNRMGNTIADTVLSGSPSAKHVEGGLRIVDNQRALFLATLDETYEAHSMVSAVSRIHTLAYEAGRLGMADLPNNVYVQQRRNLARQIVGLLNLVDERAPVATKQIKRAQRTVKAVDAPAGAEDAHAAALNYLASSRSQMKRAPKAARLFNHRHEIIQLGLAKIFDRQLEVVEDRIAAEQALQAVWSAHGCDAPTRAARTTQTAGSQRALFSIALEQLGGDDTIVAAPGQAVTIQLHGAVANADNREPWWTFVPAGMDEGTYLLGEGYGWDQVPGDAFAIRTPWAPGTYELRIYEGTRTKDRVVIEVRDLI